MASLLATFASLLAMFAIFVVVTLAHYVVPIVIVGSIVWAALLVSQVRGRRAISAEPGDVALGAAEAHAAPPLPVKGASSERRRAWHRSTLGLSR